MVHDDWFNQAMATVWEQPLTAHIAPHFDPDSKSGFSWQRRRTDRGIGYSSSWIVNCACISFIGVRVFLSHVPMYFVYKCKCPSSGHYWPHQLPTKSDNNFQKILLIVDVSSAELNVFPSHTCEYIFLIYGNVFPSHMGMYFLHKLSTILK